MRLQILAVALMVASMVGVVPQGDRAADRAEIRAHIDRIFRAFINKDAAELRATHERNWLGYLEGSHTMIRGVDGYMDNVYVDPASPYGMKRYAMREFDMIFKGDAAFVCFTADVESNTPNGPSTRVLRIADFYTKQNGTWIQTGSDTELHPESAAAQAQTLSALPDPMRKQLLEAREAVWRAYFANDRAALDTLIPEETIAIDAGSTNWSHRDAIFEGSAQFAKGGGKLESAGRRSQHSGRVTEVFVMRNGHWVNPGWHMDNEK